MYSAIRMIFLYEAISASCVTLFILTGEASPLLADWSYHMLTDPFNQSLFEPGFSFEKQLLFHQALIPLVSQITMKAFKSHLEKVQLFLLKNQKLPGFCEIKINFEDAKRTRTLNTSLLQGNLTLTMNTQQTLNITDKCPSEQRERFIASKQSRQVK